MKKIKLFCLPYAGGSAINYTKWNRYLGDSIKLYPIELPGRGRRLNETLFSDMDMMVADIYNVVSKEIDDSEYAIFGHSMGSILGFELYHEIKEHKIKEPIHVFFSGRHPPNVYMDEDNLHDLPDEEFIEEICNVGGTPKDLFKNKELSDIFIPILRSDYKLIETYKFFERDTLMDCDITVLYGEKDGSIELRRMSEWQQHTNRECRFINFSGGHFFINEEMEEIAELIKTTLL